MSITSNPPKRRSGRRNDQIPFAVPQPSKGGGAGHNGEDAIPLLLPNHVTEIHLAATGTVTLLDTIPADAYACAPVFLRNEGTAGNWLISFGGNTPGASSYSVKLGPGDSTLSTMGEGYKEANAPIGTIKAKHDNSGAGGAGVLSGFIAYNDGTSPLAGPAGIAGSTWRNGSGVPSNSLGNDGDYYLNTANGDVYVKAAGAYTVACNIKGPTGSTGAPGAAGSNGTNGAGYTATSTTSLVTAGSGSKSFTTQAGLAYSVGARIRATSTGTSEWMEGVVTSYSGTTLVATMDNNSGTGTHTDWNINLAGVKGDTGLTGSAGAAGAAGTNGAFSLISSTTLVADTAIISFTSIPNSYKHLKLVIMGRSDVAAFESNVWVQFNGDSTSGHYDWSYVIGNNNTATASSTMGTTKILVATVPAGSATRSTQIGCCDVTIPGYALTTFEKTLVSQSHSMASTAAAHNWTMLSGGLWRSTAAITQIDVSLDSSSKFKAGSIISLYGIG